MTFPFGEAVEYLAPGEQYDRASGELRPDWSAPVVALAAVAAVEPRHEGETDQTYRQANVVGYRLYHKDALSISRTWRVRVRGEVLNVTGRPADWRSPYTGFSGTVVECDFQEG